MILKFLKASEKKKLLSELEEHYGITNLPFILLEAGKEKIRGFSGTMTKEEMRELNSLVNVEVIGLYLFRKERTVRLSMDAPHVLKEKVSKGIKEINAARYRQNSEHS